MLKVILLQWFKDIPVNSWILACIFYSTDLSGTSKLRLLDWVELRVMRHMTSKLRLLDWWGLSNVPWVIKGVNIIRG